MPDRECVVLCMRMRYKVQTVEGRLRPYPRDYQLLEQHFMWADPERATVQALSELVEWRLYSSVGYKLPERVCK